MPKTPLISLLALTLAAACTPPPDGPTASSERVLAPVITTEAGSIESVDYLGTGCDGSATTGISPDKQAATSIFSEFVAAAGPGTDPDAATRNCLVMMQINVPSGWSYALESVDYRGFAGLEAGVTATRKSLYLISGSSVHTTPTARFKGATDKDYVQEDVGPDAPGNWSPCGGGQVLWIATQTDVNNHGKGDVGGQLTVDSIDTELEWRRCQ